MSELQPTDLQPSAAFHKVRVLHEEVVRCLKSKIDEPDYFDCEQCALEALVTIEQKHGGIEALITRRNPENGRPIFNLAVKIAKDEYKNVRRKLQRQEKLANADSLEPADMAGEVNIEGVPRLRELVVKCVKNLPPMEQMLAKLVAESPDQSERDLAKELTRITGRQVTRYRVTKGMSLIRKRLQCLGIIG